MIIAPSMQGIPLADGFTIRPSGHQSSSAYTQPEASSSISEYPLGIDKTPLRRGMACTFCRRRKLKCSGDRPLCTSCIKYDKVCEYGPQRAPRALPPDEPGPSNPVFSSDPLPLDSPPVPYNYDPRQFESEYVNYNINYQPLTGYEAQPDYAYTGEYVDPMYIAQPQWNQNQYLLPGVQYPPNVQFGGQILPGQVQPGIHAPGQGQTHLGLDHPQPQPPPQPLLQTLPQIHPGTQLQPLTQSHLQSNQTQSQTQPPPPNKPSSYPRPTRSTSTYLSSLSSPSTPEEIPLATTYPDISSLHYTADMDPVDTLSERLGEFLFSPESVPKPPEPKKRGRDELKRAEATALIRNHVEHDGLTDHARNVLLECFLAHSRLFFELSIPRFKYRMTFADKRRPSPALLNAMYLWATRMSHSPQLSDKEQQYFQLACRHLDTSSASSDRLMDAVRAAMLLSAYSYSSGRHHEGWILAGRAIRLVLSSGLHQIQSSVFQAPETRNPFLRNKVYLLPPPEDALELGERIHTFWCAYAIDRCGALATGFPPGIKDQDIITPFPRPLSDIASGNVTTQDDVTIRHLYRPTFYTHPEGDLPYTKWVKVVTILERASKLAFLDPEETSEYSRAWAAYSSTFNLDSVSTIPPSWLNQPKFRNPNDYRETKLAWEQVTIGWGEEGVFPIERKAKNEIEGHVEIFIPSHTIMLHHLLSAVHMLIHDVNSLDADNKEALFGARRSVAMLQSLPPMPLTDIDAFVVLVWSLIAKCLIKEMHRLNLAGDIHSAQVVEAEADVILQEMRRVSVTMHLARTQVKAMEDLKRSSQSPRGSFASQAYMNFPPGFAPHSV